MKRSKLMLSGCVHSTQKNFKKLTVKYNHVTVATPQPNLASKKHVLTQVKRPVHVTQCKAVVQQESFAQHGGKGVSFETYLRALPKLNPIDRTMGWVFHQTETEKSGAVRKISKLPPRGSIKPNPAPSEHFANASYMDTSLSRCESDRGTQGRGTPLARDANRPRLDELYRRLQVKEKAGRTPAPAVERRNSPSSTCWNRGAGVARATAEGGVVTCRWKECCTSFANHRELYVHLEACHVPIKVGVCSGVGGGALYCQWRECSDAGRRFAARYKLLLHLQHAHCTGILEQLCRQVRAAGCQSEGQQGVKVWDSRVSKGLRGTCSSMCIMS